ncbi:capsule biosynthesis protein [Halomonas dongshanensis]|uniref:Capsular biosynthesis protein n=1 Tax=Halomonas dongshanensis TaxID=2890835 RepID=A0ABT2EC57_9GAMM|nr:capsular biosynthesis protein [Halomonas dongshanensis]MCS2609166.1 capsular biosynthesis protein [Halomonas dongshanensis]
MKQQKRAFLFLQGVCSPFYPRLARSLTDAGHRVVKVNFNAGDIAYSQGTGAQQHLFRAPLNELPGYLNTLWQRYGITDQVLFGDRRPVHRAAIEGANDAGVRTHVFEEGYFRPFWITLERDGVNGHSLLPRDPSWFYATGKALPEPPKPKRFRSSFKVRALHDIGYHVAGLANPLVAPRYRNHAGITAPMEYAGYLKRFTLLKHWKKRDKARIDALIAQSKPYFLLPLQLNTDAQIRDHSPYANMEEVMDHVLGSFALHAPSDALLCIKNHPLDMGLVNYPGIIQRLSDFYGLEGRIVYLESGDLNALLKHATGTVTVNSTVGLVALEQGCPTFALSDPIYQLAGLTYQGALEEFWFQPPPPSRELFGYFHKTVMHATQVNGGFYCQTGIELAVDNAAGILQACPSPLEKLL